MAKRDYFIENDFQTYINASDWIQLINKKISICATKKYKSIHHIIENSSFMGFLFNKGIYLYEFNQGISFREHTLIPLAEIGYKFSTDDFNHLGGMPDIDSESFRLIWLDIFQFYFEKGIDLKTIGKNLAGSFVRLENQSELINYFNKNIYSIEYDNVLGIARFLAYHDKEHDLNMLKHLGFDSATPKAFEKNTADQISKTNLILKFLEKANKKQLNAILEVVSRACHKQFTSYLYKNDLNIGIMSHYDYEMAVFPKPREWYTKYQLKVIESLEQKLKIQVLETTPCNAKEVFNSIKEKINVNLTLPFGYVDGSTYNSLLANDKEFRDNN